MFFVISAKFKGTFYTEHLRVTNFGSSGHYLQAYLNDIEAVLTLNVFLSLAITLEAAIQNNLSKSWRFSKNKRLW